MAHQVHAVVQDSNDLHAIGADDPVEQEMPRLFHATGGSWNTGPTSGQMVGPHVVPDLRPILAPGLPRVHCEIINGLDQQGTVSQDRRKSELIGRPQENTGDILRGPRRNVDLEHGQEGLAIRLAFETAGRPSRTISDFNSARLRISIPCP
jgi:hypothetical protein